ncbi:uncharacterized protein [Phyllobates terribilis]|uniref:uncharacterized protein n=1 Tax=Phyllobates terribilis TaxID=111132 RepID=UPI003CCB4413
MTVFSHAGAGGGFLAGKQVYPVDYEAEASQKLLDALSSGDLRSAWELVDDQFVDVNFVGAVPLKLRKSELISRDDLPIEVRVEYESFKADVTPLFLAVQLGNSTFVRKLLTMGADVNQKLFRGFATTSAVRYGQLEILEILLKVGASQPACEEALLEASSHGQARAVEVLMGTELIRPHVAVHAFVTACSRGFSDVVSTLVRCGVDINGNDRALLVSSKPSLHSNIDCTALVAAVVSRHVSVVHILLQAGAKVDNEVKLGAWSWDTTSGEEIRVGAGLGEPYSLTWCAIEYFETSGTILKLLLNKLPSQNPHLGRTLLHHAILCDNLSAVDTLLNSDFSVESPVKTTSNTEFRPIHLAARLGSLLILHRLIQAGCDLNSRTDTGETALMICSIYKHEECLLLLSNAGADFGLVSNNGGSVSSIWLFGLQRAVLSTLKSGKIPYSSDYSVFSPLLFAAQMGDIESLKILIARSPSEICCYTSATANARELLEKLLLEYALQQDGRATFHALHCASRGGDVEAVRLLTVKGYDVNVADNEGNTPLMLAAKGGHINVCHLLISRGARCDTAAVAVATNGTERVILDHMARELVVNGGRLMKHTKGGRGAAHIKTVKMVADVGVLEWGKSSRRKVVCMEAGVGPSGGFRRRKKGDVDEAGLFHVVTTKNKEVHFVCGGKDEAELWVRGIKLVTKDATFGG